MIFKDQRVRRALSFLIPLLLFPCAVLLFVFLIDNKYHLLCSLLLVCLVLALFAAGYEKKRIGRRRMVVSAVMTALAAVSRLIPILKPVTALTIIGGIHLGKEAGFLIGALSALLSNFYFGQGPWTPFQMLGWGLIGYFAGVFSKALQKSRALLLLYGLFSGVAYSLIMDVFTSLAWGEGFGGGVFFATVLSALPHTLLYVFSNCLFLLLLARPFGKKLMRIRVKYGL